MEERAPRIAVEFEIQGLELWLENRWRSRFVPGWAQQDQKDREKRSVGLKMLEMRSAIDRLAPPFVVVATMISPWRSKRPDDDNVAGALKNSRDTIAKFLHVDDGDREKIRFINQDEKGPWAVRVHIEGNERTP